MFIISIHAHVHVHARVAHHVVHLQIPCAVVVSKGTRLTGIGGWPSHSMRRTGHNLCYALKKSICTFTKLLRIVPVHDGLEGTMSLHLSLSPHPPSLTLSHSFYIPTYSPSTTLPLHSHVHVYHTEVTYTVIIHVSCLC